MNKIEKKRNELAAAVEVLKANIEEAVKALSGATNSNVILVGKDQREAVVLRVTGDTVEFLKDEGKVIEDLGMNVKVLYDRDNQHGKPWVISFHPFYGHKGHYFAGRGLKAVQSIGLDLPENAFMDKEGVVHFGYMSRPTAGTIAFIGNQIKREVESIMEDFFRTDAILKAAQEGDGK
ncbi:MAG: hypothetical protein WC329_01720 [Candidatus Omnitrophota bacterium]|jgi:hypothetical protein